MKRPSLIGMITFTCRWRRTFASVVSYAISPAAPRQIFYLWLFKHRATLEKELGWHVDLEAAAIDLVTEHSPQPQRIVARVEEKFLDALTPDALEAGPAPGQWRQERVAARHDERLFADILVPVSGDEGGWQALDLALKIARREESHLLGATRCD